MKITVSKVKRELLKKHGWENMNCPDNEWFVNALIKDTIDIINDELLRHKNISIMENDSKTKTLLNRKENGTNRKSKCSSKLSFCIKIY